MILGVGIDIVNIQRFKRAIERWGDRFLNRIFTDGELGYYSDRERMGEFLAGRFAAKEAFIKAIGGRYGLSLSDIEILRASDGRPILRFDSSRLDVKFGGIRAYTSIAHDGDHAIASCIIEGE